MSSTAVVIEDLVIPPSLATGDAAVADLLAVVELAAEREDEAIGTRETAYSAEETLASWALVDFEPKRCLVARLDGRVVGSALVEWSIADDDEAAWVTIDVGRESRGLGVGSALRERVEEIVRSLPRAVVQSHCSVPAGWSGSAYPARTGAGSLPADDPRVRRFVRDGWTLEQVERMSVLTLPLDGAILAAHRDEASAARGASEYAVVTWVGPTPEEHVAGMTTLHTRMSTDAPSGGLSVPEEPWTPERLVAYDASASAQERTSITTAAIHLPSGELAAFTDLRVPVEPGLPAFQWETIVLREHRGHRLGMRIKAENLAALADASPACPRIYTWNAEENRPMLAVNEALGFVPRAAEGLWKRTLL